MTNEKGQVMNRKIETRKLGKKLRKETGLALPVCMRAAHLLVRDRGGELKNHPMIGPFIEYAMFPCGMDCCGPRGYQLAGPKGAVDIPGY